MHPTHVLTREHETILEAIDLLEEATHRLDAGVEVPPEVLSTLVEFLAAFADGLHHAKEEEMLFPALGKAGLPPHGGPVAVMLAEHERGRGLLGSMRSAAADGASDSFVDAGLAYAALLREHIHKENEVLFPMAERALPEAERAELARAFDVFDGERRAEEHARCRELLSRLRRALG